LQAGVLLERSVDELKGRSINAEWLLELAGAQPDARPLAVDE
jgi:hypothetical protein